MQKENLIKAYIGRKIFKIVKIFDFYLLTKMDWRNIINVYYTYII